MHSPLNDIFKRKAERAAVTSSSMPRPHPLDPLCPEEIRRASAIIKALPPHNEKQIHFKFLTLLEPPKAALIVFLEEEASGAKLTEPSYPPRKAQTLFYHFGSTALYKAVIEITPGAEKVEVCDAVDTRFHAQLDVDEIVKLKEKIMTEPAVIAELRKRGIGEDANIVCTTWPYGRDEGKETRRLSQYYFYMRNPHTNDSRSNEYNWPLDFSPVVDIVTKEIITMIQLPTGGLHSTPNPKADEERNARKACDWHPELQSESPRKGLKPLIVTQPEGPSFEVQGSLIEWQKWRFRLGFNWREGPVLHDLRFDGRKTFHRISLAEMFVPYGDPRKPYSRKSVFDVGDVGAGVCANNLQLGCDCLGVIKYFSYFINDSQGQPVEKPNAVCMHEIDNGIGWKHTDHIAGTVGIVRNRVLVLQSIITVGNYEYIFAFHLDQAAGIHYEIRATGILSTHGIDQGITVPWGTVVNEGVLAPFHQHVFNLRVDPAIDGHQNTVVQEDSVAMPWDDDNQDGVGYVVEKTPITRSTPLDLIPGRVFKITNPNIKNPITNSPVAYSIHQPVKLMLLAHPGSWHAKRAAYARHPIWITRHRDGELFPAGDYTYQSMDLDGLDKWAARDDSVDNEDLVVWMSISLTHNPRVEDWPVMPVDIMSVSLKPSNFFSKNPALDVPQSTQGQSCSVLYEDAIAKSRSGSGEKEGCGCEKSEVTAKPKL